MTESVGPFRYASCSLISGESPPGDRLPVLQRHCGHPSVLLAGAHAPCSGGQLSASGHLSACLAVQAEHRAGHSTVSSTGLLEGRVAHHPCLVRSSWHAPADGKCFTATFSWSARRREILFCNRIKLLPRALASTWSIISYCVPAAFNAVVTGMWEIVRNVWQQCTDLAAGKETPSLR